MGIQVKDSRRKILARIFNKIHLTLFTLLVFACYVVIFPINCDLSDFLQPRVSTIQDRIDGEQITVFGLFRFCRIQKSFCHL